MTRAGRGGHPPPLYRTLTYTDPPSAKCLFPADQRGQSAFFLLLVIIPSVVLGLGNGCAVSFCFLVVGDPGGGGGKHPGGSEVWGRVGATPDGRVQRVPKTVRPQHGPSQGGQPPRPVGAALEPAPTPPSSTPVAGLEQKGALPLLRGAGLALKGWAACPPELHGDVAPLVEQWGEWLAGVPAWPLC